MGAIKWFTFIILRILVNPFKTFSVCYTLVVLLLIVKGFLTWRKGLFKMDVLFFKYASSRQRLRWVFKWFTYHRSVHERFNQHLDVWLKTWWRNNTNISSQLSMSSSSGNPPVKNGSNVWTDLTGCLELAANEDEIGRTDRQLMVVWRACHCDDSCKDDSTRRWQHMFIITVTDNSVTRSTVECGLYSDCFLGNLIRYLF